MLPFPHMHNQQTEWLRSLDFYYQELEILKSRLPEMQHANGVHPTGELALFGDKFYVQQQNIIRLQHGISNNLATVCNEVRRYGEADPAMANGFDYSNLSGKFEAEEQAIRALRLSFNSYCAKHT